MNNWVGLVKVRHSLFRLALSSAVDNLPKSNLKGAK